MAKRSERGGGGPPAAIEINPEFGRALELMEAGARNLFVTGRAGTGKSTLLEHFRANTGTNPVVLAPTGVAALNVRGQTIHRFFGFGVDATPEKVRASRRKPRDPELIARLTTVVIDEVSMLRADLLDCIDVFLRKHGPMPRTPFGGVHMVFVGDLYQLPPVVTGEEREIFRSVYETPYFFSARALADEDLDVVELQKVYRQKDADFVELLGRIRNDSVDDADMARLNARLDPGFEPPPDAFHVSLTTTNRNADRINETRLESLPGRMLVSRADIGGDFGREHHPTATELTFKEGAQVMLLNNDAAGRWVNGSIGTVESLEAGRGRRRLPVRAAPRRRRPRRGPAPYLGPRPVRPGGGTHRQRNGRLLHAASLPPRVGRHHPQVPGQDLRPHRRGIWSVARSPRPDLRGAQPVHVVRGHRLRRPIAKSSIRADWRIRQFLTGYHYPEVGGGDAGEEKAAAIQRAIEENGPDRDDLPEGK